jgi:hypothetical protein
MADVDMAVIAHCINPILRSVQTHTAMPVELKILSTDNI